VSYHLIVDAELKQDMARMHAAWKQDSNSPAGREFQAAMDSMRALREGRESEYEGKQLGSGPSSYDLRDAAQLKVPVFREYTERGRPLGPSHRLIYREFEPLPKVEDGRVVPDPNAHAYRQAVAFVHRGDDPAAVAGKRLGRERGRLQPELHGLTGGGRPSVGPDRREGIQTTPHRIPVPPDLIRQAAILRDSPPPTARPPAGTPTASGPRPTNPGQARERDR
jgi:hypothetical protein